MWKEKKNGCQFLEISEPLLVSHDPNSNLTNFLPDCNL